MKVDKLKNKIHTKITELENEIREKVEPSRQRLAAAKAEVPQREREEQDAADAVADIHGSFKARDGRYTSLDLAVAQAEVTRASIAARGARDDLERAKRNLLSDDKSLADIFVPVLTLVLPVEWISTFADRWDKPSGIAPVGVVQQRGKAAVSDSGALSGDLTLTFHRGSIHRPMQADPIIEAAHRMGYRVEALGGVRSTDDKDTLNLRVRSAFDSTPVIPSIDEGQIQTLGRALASDLATSIRYDGHGVATNSLTGVMVSSHIVTVPHGWHVVSEDVDSNGKRTVVIDSLVLLRSKTPLLGRRLEDVIEEVVERQGQNRFTPGLGVAVSCERVTDSELSADRKMITIALNKATDTPTDAYIHAGYIDGDDHQIVIRTTLRSSVSVDAAESLSEAA